MEHNTAWRALPGATVPEKCASLGIACGEKIDIRELDKIARKYGIEIYLFFEKDLLCTHTIERVQEEYKEVPEFERPYIRVDRFLAFTKKNDPSFAQTLQEFPLMIEIARIGGGRSAESGEMVPVISGLMPFLDELDVDAEPPQVNVPVHR
jgi:hypothetical protein